jgi:DNA-binding NarL/FixJ family response regulator
MKISVGIVDDKPFLTQQLAESISLFEEFEIVWTAENGLDALEKAAQNLPKIVLMDIDMPKMNGIEAVRSLKAKYTELKIIMLTIFDDEDKIFDAILAGANGYMLKDSKLSRLVSAMEDALENGAPMSPSIAAKTLTLLRLNQTNPQQRPEEPAPFNNISAETELTKREIEILELWVQGKSYQQISGQLYISIGTIRKHIGNIYGKIHVHSRIEALKKAQSQRWFK